MYDELVKRLREVADEVDNDYDVDPYNAEQRCLAILEAAGAIEWLSKPRWIPVTERLPSENDRYLTVAIEPWFGTTVVDTMRWSGVWMYDGRQAEATVTHWMPLPQPPKEED